MPGKRRPVADAVTTKRSADGQAAEAIAARYLEAKGLRVLERNYRCRAGEIDLVLADGPALVFAEVRFRANRDFGGAAASIGWTKQAKIIKAARHYLAGKPERPCRFDVVLLDRLDEKAVEWIQDAFSA